ncbi:RNA uridylyltransferase [Aureococcus anophagefferens]|nr:RNA uridylyltransferase [Aureococcus anophagefferens]
MVVVSHLCLLLAAASAEGVVRRYSELEGRPSASPATAGRLVNGSRVLLLSGSIHYPRSTPAMWPKLFAEARANGLNAIESYAFWNKHSATRYGAYDYGFNGDVDLFLSLAAEHDLFVLWRFGPYAWIHDVPGMKTRTNNTAWLNETGRWMRDHFAVIEPHLSRNGASNRIENEYGGSKSDAAAVAYVDALDALADAVAPELVWMMCGFVSLVAPDALHTGNGCPHDQGPASAHVVVPPAPGADPAWYTEDELWYDAWGLPSLARPPADVAYGVASYVATCVRYANAAPLRSDGSRHEPLFSHLAAVHGTLDAYAEVLLGATPEALATPVVALDGASGAVLFNTSDVAPVDAPAIACGPALAWTNWTDGDGRGWFAADFAKAQGAGDAATLLDLDGLGTGMVFLDGAHVTNFNLATADCGQRGKPRCGSRQVAGAYAGVVPEPNAPGDGSCGRRPSATTYPEAADAKTILIAVPPGEAARNPSKVRVCARALGATS